MIERYTIKFGAAVSQKELEKELHESGDISIIPKLHQMKARRYIAEHFNLFVILASHEHI
jgi:hypothetical protein